MNLSIRKLLNEPLMWLSLYLFMSINTFGHAWVYIGKIAVNETSTMIASIADAIFWPLYWSIRLWS